MPYVVCTGGEPLLQLDEALITAFKAEGLEIALETNGTLPVPEGVDWICVSPKGASEIVQTRGHELKLVYPQSQAMPERFRDLEFDNYYLQPLDDALQTANTKAAVEYCMAHPQWKLSLQTHKFIGID